MGSITRPSLTGIVLLLGASCSIRIGSPGEGAVDADVPIGEVALAIVSPIAGSSHARDFVGSLGDLAALVELEVDASGPIMRIAFETSDGVMLGNAGNDKVLMAEFAEDGEVTVIARAFGLDGDVVATDSISFMVQAPEADDCYDWLDLYGVEYRLGPYNQGVIDPVTVTTPINGMSFRYLSRSTPRETFFMDCHLAVSLARAAPHLRKRDIIEVVDIGVYNYRCIGGGEPPGCSLSQHAYAKGIDIAGFTTGDGTYYSVRHDWIIDDDGPTCSSPTEGDKDRFLHDIICELKNARVWNIVLTPNYNDAHRDHFHVDLTSGADYINRVGQDSVDVGPDNH